MELSEFSDYTRILHNRISKIDPENVRKIIGFLLLHDQGDQQMAQLALGPDHQILEIVHQVKTELHLLALRSMPAAVSPSSSGFGPFALPRSRNFAPSSSTWDQQIANKPSSYSDALYEFQNSNQYFCLDEHMDSYVDNNSSTRSGPRHYSTAPEFHHKICHFYAKGHCKHGNDCRYLHCNPMSEMCNSSCSADNHLRPGSLEFEIVDLLKSRRGIPISIASLPMIYFEKYGKHLQAEGYLTESQRHGKSGFSLTKLLARLKSIQVIDRPHGQHSVILAEDASRFIDYRTEKNDPGLIVSSARQIYLTFPADSTFTEDDVSQYFSSRYGMVEDVRIPCQEKRMFGFVTFHSVETVNQILSQENEHLICGARVLVKPYREKSKLERKNQERSEHQHQAYCTSHFNNLESEQLHSTPRRNDVGRILRRIEEQQQQQQALEFHQQQQQQQALEFHQQQQQQQALEFHQQQQQQQALEVQQQQQLEIERRLSEMSLKGKSIIRRPYFNYQTTELKVPEDYFSFPITEKFDHMLDALKSGSDSDSGSGSVDDNKPPQNLNGRNLTNNPQSEYNLPESI